MAESACARRHNWGLAYRLFLVHDVGQSAVHLDGLGLLGYLCFQYRTGQQQGTGQELASSGGTVGCFRCRSFCLFGFLSVGKPIADGSLMAFVQTVHASHTAAAVYRMVLHIDAGCLAIAGAKRTAIAFLLVNRDAEQGKAGEESQHGAHRTDGITIGTSVACRQYHYQYQHDRCHYQHRQTLEPDIHRIEGIAVHAFGHRSQQVVSPHPQRLQEAVCRTAVHGIRVEQGYQGMHTQQHRQHEHCQHTVAQPAFRLGIRVGHLLASPAQTGHHVLKHAQRTNDRTVHSARYEREQYQTHDYSGVQRQQSRKKLYLRHPAEPCMKHTREIDEQQCHEYQA